MPVHIRQEDASSEKDDVPVLSQWKFNDSDDNLLLNHNENFYRICPIVNHNETNSLNLQV